MAKKNIIKIKNILLIDDDKIDLNITKKALLESGFKGNLNEKSNITDAIRFLKNSVSLLESPEVDIKSQYLPDLIFVDLNMPEGSGFDFLKEIKSDSKLKSKIVVVLSSSNSKKDIDKSYLLGANSFIQKPLKFDEFKNSVLNLLKYYNETVLFPE